MEFQVFSDAYLEQLEARYRGDPQGAEWVLGSPGLGDFTLLCFEQEGLPCHRLVLARWLEEKQPALELASPLR